jgi:Uma2 family endonuclease
MSALRAPIPPQSPRATGAVITTLRPVKTIYEYDHPLTVEEFERLPEGEGKQELHDGRVVEMAPVGGLHGAVALKLGAVLLAHVEQQSQQAGRRTGWVTTETGYRLWPGRRATRAPDVAFIGAERAPTPSPRRIVRAVPDLAVEVLSPDDRPGEVETKVQEYLDTGVRLVWVIDPFLEVLVYRPGQPIVRLASDDSLTGEDIVPGFSRPVREVWPGDPAEFAADGGDGDDEG